MATFSYTLLQLIQYVSFDAGDFKAKIESLTNPDLATQQMIYYVNAVIRKIWSARATPWNQGESTISVQAHYTTATTSPVAYAGGVITLTNGSASATMDATADVSGDAANWVNRAVWLSGSDANYGFMRVQAAVAATENIALTFDRPWPYATQAAKSNWVASLDRYELPSDFGDFISAVTIPTDAAGSSSTTPSRTLKMGDVEELERLRYTYRSSANTLGNPNFITVAKKSSNNLWVAELDPFPEDAGMIQFRYKKIPTVLSADADVIPLPDDCFDLLASGVLAMWQQRRRQQGNEKAFDIWQQTALQEWLVMGHRRTDGRPAVVPADTMRSGTSGLI